jgi:NAD(P)-dependent dehydrogenase (short-subunit alcohol dehydrogenase family)
MEELAGRVAVVTGGASGIGLAMAERFAAQDMKLAITDIEEDALDAAAKQLTDGGAEVLAVPTDVSKADEVEAFAVRVRERFGAFHVVCNNAGVGGHGFRAWDTPTSEWQWVLGVNLWGVIHGIGAFVPALVEQDEGHVVNTASLAGLASLPFMAPYSATKHAVLAISETLHHDLTMVGSAVKVTCSAPGSSRRASPTPTATGSSTWARSRRAITPPARSSSRSCAVSWRRASRPRSSQIRCSTRSGRGGSS